MSRPRLAAGPGPLLVAWCADTAGTRISVDVPSSLPAQPAAVEVAAYRIVQAALTNVVHHARARTCAVRIAVVGEHLVVDVTDDGIGLPDRGLTPGVGLASMGERAAEMGGECRTEAAPHGGTRVLARPPLSGDQVPSTRVLVVEDHPLFRKGVLALLDAVPDLEVFDSAASARRRSRRPPS